MSFKSRKKKLSQWIWDAWCITSVIGIWPRFIEPKLLKVNMLNLPIAHLPPDLNGIKIVHFSDLHWKADFDFSFVKKMISKINSQKPDFIFFTGDFLCRSHLENPKGLKQLLCALKAKWGQFAVLGNHDYENFVTINAEGDYDMELPSSSSDISKGFKRLLFSRPLSKRVTKAAKQINLHAALMQLVQETPFQLLHNFSTLVKCRKSFINICGLGEYILGRSDSKKAFSTYDPRYPGIILTHNPDAIEQIKHYPGDLILAGHTHGGQINLPGLWQKFTYIENKKWKSGLKRWANKWIYINRGIGSVMDFRWFAMPEISVYTLYGA